VPVYSGIGFFVTGTHRDSAIADGFNAFAGSIAKASPVLPWQIGGTDQASIVILMLSPGPL